MKFPVRMSGFLLVWCGRDSVMGFFFLYFGAVTVAGGRWPARQRNRRGKVSGLGCIVFN